MIRFGVHCSLRGGLVCALEEAQRIGCEAVQIFTRSPRMWKMKLPDPAEVERFKVLRKELDIHPLVVHTPYLPNLATSKETLYAASRQCLQDDLVVAGQLEADYLVIHPGSYSEGSSPDEGIARIARAINEVLAAVPGRTVILFENAAGGGRRLAGSFAEIARMMDGIKDKTRVGVCFDTAHALGAGYDVSTRKGIDAALADFDRQIGLGNLKVVHFNDSLAPLGSRRDRHQHLGKGYVGEAGFKYLIRRVQGVAAAGILETPKDTPTADKKNLSLLLRWRGSPKKSRRW